MRMILGCILAATLSPTTIFAGNHYDSTICPSASEIHGNFDVAIPGRSGKSYYVFSTVPGEMNRLTYWLAAGNLIKADSSQEALVKANNLLATVVGPVFEKPSVYTVPENGATYQACQYKTSDDAVIMTAIFDDAYNNDMIDFNRYTYKPRSNGCGGGICRK